MKTLYFTSAEEIQFFFDEKFKLLDWWCEGDAQYRSEYMDPLLKKLGIKTEYIEASDKRVFNKIKKALNEISSDLVEGFEENYGNKKANKKEA